MKETSSKEKCIEVLKDLGFRPNNNLGGNLHDFGGFDCLVWINDNYIKLSVYGKTVPFSDDGYIGPPLPDEAKLRAFLNYNTA